MLNLIEIISFLKFSEEQLSLDSRLETLCQQFISHNLTTGNFGSLIIVFLNKVSELLELSDKERYKIKGVFTYFIMFDNLYLFDFFLML